MDDNREKQIKEFRITQSADKKPGTQPLHVVIMPTSLSTGQQQKSLLDNRSEPMITYSSHFPVTQTKAKPVRLVLMPALSKTDQQLPCKRITNQSERKILLLPHSVVKQGKNALLQSNLTDQSAKKVCVLTAMKDHSVTSCNTTDAEDCTGTQHGTSDSHFVLQATHVKNLHSMVSSVGGIDVQAFQKSLAFKGKNVASVNPFQVALLPKEGQKTQKTDAENDLEATQSSKCYISQCGKSSTYLNETHFSSESQQCENMNTSKDSKLKEAYVLGGPDSRPGMVPPHLTVMTASPKEDQLYSVVSSVGETDVEAFQKSLASKGKTIASVNPVQVALLPKEGQKTQKTDAENDLEATQSSKCYISQCGKSSTYLNETHFSSESQQCENMNTSKDSKLKEAYVLGGPDSRPGMVPPHLTVMTASPKEIDYRIKAFLARKRAELDVQNVEEYCLHIGMNPNVCARVDATVHQHRKRKKRKFEFAPQPEEEAEGTQSMSKNASHEQLPLLVAHPILEERVSNVEEHLRLGKPVPKDIYSRLKRIEDRILKLEGISPEYTYDATVNLHPPRNLPKIKRRCTTDELDAKIAELKKKLEKKSDCTSQKDIVK